MASTASKPRAPGSLLFVASGGNCPGKDWLAESVYDYGQQVNRKYPCFSYIYGAREGLGMLMDGDASCLTKLTRKNVNPQCLSDPPVVSFATRGPSGKLEEWVPIVRTLLERGIRYLVLWGGDYTLWSAGALQGAIEAVAKERDGERLYFGCLPKSIDNDLSGLEDCEQAIGFSSSAQWLARNLENLGRDARDSDNFVHVPIVQGNQAGHLCERAA